MNTKNNAVVLARVSGRSQEDGYSLDSQEKLLHGYCMRKEFKIRKVFRITETASKAQRRTVFKEMINYINKKDIQHLVIEKTDRFTRNLRDAVIIDDWFNADETRFLHAVKEGFLLHKNAKSDVKFMWNISIAVAKKYTDNLREETMKGWAEKLAQGWMPSPPPPGYKTAIKDGRKIHVPDERTSNGVKKAFKLYLEDGENIRTVGEALDKMGIKTRTGRSFSKSNVHKMILTNPYYMGTIQFDGKMYPGAQKPLITEALYNAVQKKMNSKAPNKKIARNHPLKSLMTCSDCERMITWQKQKNRLYGACQRKLEACKGKKFIRDDRVQEAILDRLDKLVCPSTEIMEWTIDMLNNEFHDTTDNRQETVDNMTMEISKLNRMDELMYDDKLSGDIASDRYETKHKEFTARIQKLRDDLAGMDDIAVEKHEEAITILKLTQNAARIYRELDDADEKRLILTKLFKSMVVGYDSVSVKFTNFVEAISQCSEETRKIMQTLNTSNQTIKKDPDYTSNLDLSEQQIALRSVWCG